MQHLLGVQLQPLEGKRNQAKETSPQQEVTIGSQAPNLEFEPTLAKINPGLSRHCVWSGWHLGSDLHRLHRIYQSPPHKKINNDKKVERMTKFDTQAWKPSPQGLKPPLCAPRLVNVESLRAPGNNQLPAIQMLDILKPVGMLFFNFEGAIQWAIQSALVS